MVKGLSTLVPLAFVALVQRMQAIAQEAPQQQGMPPPEWYWHGPWQGPWHGTTFWWVCPLMMLFMLIVIGALFFFSRKHHWEPPWHMMDRAWGPPSHSALQILNERFARGEIQKDEYEEKKAAILAAGP